MAQFLFDDKCEVVSSGDGIVIWRRQSITAFWKIGGRKDWSSHLPSGGGLTEGNELRVLWCLVNRRLPNGEVGPASVAVRFESKVERRLSYRWIAWERAPLDVKQHERSEERWVSPSSTSSLVLRLLQRFLRQNSSKGSRDTCYGRICRKRK